MTATPTPIADLTIEALASAAGTTTRTIRSLQTQGLLDHPVLQGRTGIYTSRHLERLSVIFRLQSEGFSLHSLSVLFDAYERGESLPSVLGLTERARNDEPDEADRYGFVELQTNVRPHMARRGRPLLSIVPTTLWNQTAAS